LERTAVGVVHRLGPADDTPDLVARFHERLPFPLTDAQRRAITEIEADLAAPHPMHRLLQGDVGSGKTVVAVSALLVAVRSGHQGALMAPTEVLAEQHHAGIRALLEGFTLDDGGSSLFGERPLRVELLTNRTTAAERRRILEGLAAGDVDLAIGTHALIQDAVDFRSLGVVVIDEQHRFGVEQRAALRAKSRDGATPDVLVMTATPIPRTAAMTVYGDLDVSVLDELPPGRTPITTRWVTSDREDEAWEQVRAEVAAGRQAYVVCPLIEESEKLDAQSAEATFARLRAPGGALADLSVGLLHGRLPSAEKDAVMAAFRARELAVIVATTVIEVGVDVPNATVMVILDADRFGIAQLHQLRGRVGRGADRSWCYLVGDGATPDGQARLEALVRSTDGFELAEVDLDLRGEGTLMGERQKGRNDLKLASLRRDREWVVHARRDAFELVGSDPSLRDHPELAAEIDLLLGEDDADFLLKS
jgi:ATP-dependent DNA helicase RecG